MKKISILLSILFIFSINLFSQLDFDINFVKQCARTNYTFTPLNGISDTDDSLVWHWDETSETTSSYPPNSEITHRFNGAGEFTVYFEIYNDGSPVQTSLYKDVTVYDKPSINIEYTNPGITCAPEDSVKIIYTSTNAIEHPQTNFIINWGDDTDNQLEDVNSYNTDIYHTYQSTSCGQTSDIGPQDNFLITVTGSNICNVGVSVWFAEIKSKPSVGFSLQDTADVTYDEVDKIYHVCEAGNLTLLNNAYTDSANCLDVENVLWNIYFGDNELDDSHEAQEYTYNFEEYGIYKVQLSQDNPCGIASTYQWIEIRELPEVKYEITEQAYCYPVELFFVNSSDMSINVSYWDFLGDSSIIITDSLRQIQSFEFKDKGEYNVRLWGKDDYCKNLYDSTLIFENLCEDIYVPNAFIPLSDNDILNTFKPKGQKLLEYRLDIYNLYGEHLWSSKEITEGGVPAEGWDGKFKGEICPQGTYIWKIYAVIDEGQFGTRNWEGMEYKEGKNGKDDKKATSGTFLLIR